MTVADKPHGRGRYNAGCRCGTCKEANREYQRARRSRQHLRAVTTPPGDVTPALRPAGAVAQAVQLQMHNLEAAQDRPAMMAIAIALAEVLDNSEAVPQHSAAARVLTDLLTSLSKGSGRKGKLTLVRSMTSHPARNKP